MFKQRPRWVARQPRKKVNTPLARKIAQIYEQQAGPFPGGIKNACITRTNAGRVQRSSGAWSWQLDPIDTSNGFAMPCGSQYPAREAVENLDLIAWT